MSLVLFALLFPWIASPVLAQDTSAFTFEAQIVGITDRHSCASGDGDCMTFQLQVGDGTLAGQSITVEQRIEGDATANRYALGNNVIVQTETLNGEAHYFVSDVVRRPALFWLTIFFLTCVVLLGGKTALRSVVGMVVTFLILFLFMLPRLLAGDNPLTISIVGGAAIMLCTLTFAHGLQPKTWAALGGTLGSLILTGVLATLFSAVAHLTGFADEATLYLLNDFPSLNAQGLLLAGIIIGTLGVLDDITIAQASAVFELHAANATLTAQSLYRRALRIGNDHIAAAVNTLILAYAGSSLPLLLLLSGGHSRENWLTVINREAIATEIIRTLVGSIGLLAAVPFTTFLASRLAVRTRHQGKYEPIHHH